MTRPSRNWCARASFGDGLKPFIFGDVRAATELEAERLLLEAWRTICPHPVQFLAVIPGMLVFVEEE